LCVVTHRRMQLSVAAQQGDEATVKRLLAECAAEDVNFADERGLTPLHWACSCDEQAVAGLLLADPRADVDARSRHGMTAVHCAASANALRVLPMLLQSRASHLLGAPNEWGEAPLHVAATAGHAGAVKVLLSYGAATDVADRWGRRPLAWQRSRASPPRRWTCLRRQRPSRPRVRQALLLALRQSGWRCSRNS